MARKPTLVINISGDVPRVAAFPTKTEARRFAQRVAEQNGLDLQEDRQGDFVLLEDL